MKNDIQQAEAKRLDSLNFFKKRAFSSLQKISDGVYDYSDSLLLYIPGSDDKYKKMQDQKNPYYEMITAPERTYLQQIAKNVVTRLPDAFEYIDLGPGSEHKEQYLFNEIQKQKKNCLYIPVDISQKFLDKAVEHAEKQGLSVKPIRAPFEKLPNMLQKSKNPIFVSIGLTYSNYEPQKILKLLKNIIGNEGFAFINSQIRERIDLNRLVEIYKKDATPIAKTKLTLLGLNPKTDVTNLETDDKIQMWCTLKTVTPKLATKGLKSGDKLLLFQSLRPTLEEFTKSLKKSNFDNFIIFDTGAPFVGALLEKYSKKNMATIWKQKNKNLPRGTR